MHIGYLLAERQAYPAAAHAFERFMRSLDKRFEDSLLLLFRDTYSIVLYHNGELLVPLAPVDSRLDTASVRSIFEGIGQQIVDESLQTHLITPYHKAVHGMGETHLYLPVRRHVLEVIVDTLQQVHDVYLAHL